MAVSVQIQNLTKSFGRTLAVHDVTLTIEPGELFFLLGPSGCGKTTLLRCVAGFCDPDIGRIHIGQRDITHLPPHQRDTGMVFQSYALWPHMTVRQNVAFGLEMRKISKQETAKRVEEMLAMVRMDDRANAKPNQLSGGQQQRIALARALVVHPQCLLLDEPLSNLDAKLRLEMRQEIRRICKEVGRTAIYVTHDQKEALSIADRIAVIDHGRVQQVGTPQDVYGRPASRFVAGFIGETNFVPGKIASSGHGETRVHTPIGNILSRHANDRPLHEGDSVTLSLRPEAIHLGTAPKGIPNVFAGAAHHTVYLGEMAQHQVNVHAADGNPEGLPPFKVFDLNPKIMVRDAAAETQVWIDPDDVVILKE